MSDRYYRKRVKDVKNDDSINVVLDLQRKIKHLENNINLENIFRYNLKDNIFVLIKNLKILLT